MRIGRDIRREGPRSRVCTMRAEHVYTGYLRSTFHSQETYGRIARMPSTKTAFRILVDFYRGGQQFRDVVSISTCHPATQVGVLGGRSAEQQRDRFSQSIPSAS